MFDTHVHVPDDNFFEAFSREVLEASARYFRAEVRKMGFREVEEELLSQGVERYALLPVPYRGFDPERVNRTISGYVSSSNMAVGLAAVNPERDPVGEMKAALGDGLVGLKLHPSLQQVYPNDRRLRGVYELLEGVGGVVVVHTGTSGIGAGMRGGGGIRLDYSRPIWVDEVAAEHPGVSFVLAHFGWPWVDEAIAICLHKANVYLDLSGWSPKYVPSQVWGYANTLLQDRVVVGSDFPFLKPKRVLEELSQAPLKPEVREKVLRANAHTLFRLRA